MILQKMQLALDDINITIDDLICKFCIVLDGRVVNRFLETGFFSVRFGSVRFSFKQFEKPSVTVRTFQKTETEPVRTGFPVRARNDRLRGKK